MNIPGRITFILSTGRTGTHFFKNYLNFTCDRMNCLHEPKPSRIFKIYSNMYLNNKIKPKLIYKKYIVARQRYFEKLHDCDYVESNNFIFGCVPALNHFLHNILIVHIIRHPVDYIVSHLNHGFWNIKKKLFAKYCPYWLENIHIDEELKNDPVIMLAERWKYVNEQIKRYKESNMYMNTKFENLFNENKNISVSEINRIRKFLNCDTLSDARNIHWLSRPTNTSKKSQGHELVKEFHLKYINDNLWPLMQEYNYFIE